MSLRCTGNWGDASTMDTVHASAADTKHVGDKSSSLDGLTELSTLVMNNMDTLPKVRDVLLQNAVEAAEGDRADLTARIQSKLDVMRKTFHQKGSFDSLSVIREIPDEVLAGFRNHIALVIQGVVDELVATHNDMCGNLFEYEEGLPGTTEGVLTSLSIESLSSAVRSKLDACLAEAHVAMSGHLASFADGLLASCGDQVDVADATNKVLKEVQEIMTAKVAVATHDCFEDTHRIIKNTKHLLEKSKGVSSAETVEADRNTLSGTVEGCFDNSEKVTSASTLATEAVTEHLQRDDVFLDTSNEDPFGWFLHRTPSGDKCSDDRALYTSSLSSSPGTESSYQREVPAVSPPIAPDMNVDAVGNSYSTGSVGHPELCSRPCVFAAAGHCELGFACAFCHMAHEKGRVRLDKTRRDALREMTYEERVATILPLVRIRVVALQLDQDLLQDISDILTALQPLSSTSDVTRSMRKIQRTHMTKFTLRSLLKMIKDDESVDTPSELQASVDLLFSKIKADIVLRAA
eukprot:TRINITY_DN38400_c0_g1_i1.p1 TRINITY_DN38400_c0_g1~~TRINITY_DN38400_c0_g1_i1.p1  ORF type:complete len:520 (+),score=73.75 TRINITY_DN38400_c0_g1_i1:206-1765(+)